MRALFTGFLLASQLLHASPPLAKAIVETNTHEQQCTVHNGDTTCVRISEDKASTEAMFQATFTNGGQAAARGDLQGAAKHYSQATVMRPDLFETHFNEAEVYRRLGQPAPAIEPFARAARAAELIENAPSGRQVANGHRRAARAMSSLAHTAANSGNMKRALEGGAHVQCDVVCSSKSRSHDAQMLTMLGHDAQMPQSQR